jgi:hypothetical protein
MAKDKKYGGNYMKAVDDFTKKYPYATIDTIAKSYSTGGYYKETKGMFNWLDSNQALSQQYPMAAPALAPDLTKDTKYYQPAHTLLLNLGIRQRMSPQDFMDQFQISAGNSYYYNWIKPQYEEYRKVNKSAAYKWKQQMVQWYGANYNTGWLNSYNAGVSTTNKLQALHQFTQMAQDSNLSSQQRNLVDGLMQVYKQINPSDPNAAYQQMQVAIRTGKIDSASARDQWQSWMDDIIKANPNLKQGIMTLFYNLG